MRSRPIQIAIALVLACAGYAGWFVGSTLGIVDMPKAALLAAALLVSLVTVPLAGEWRLPETGDGVTGIALASAGGALTLWAAPYIALLQRSSDAPSGTETLMFAAVAWGVITVIVAFSVRAWRPPYTAPAAAVCAAVGAAALLGNWERPSSFSPLVKFPVREGWMLVAGVLFAVGTLLVLEASTRLGPKKAHTLAFGSAAAVGLLVALPSIPVIIPRLSVLAGTLVLSTVAYAAFSFSWFVLADEVGPARGSSALMLVPVALTALTVVERTTGARGADPIVWGGAIAGIAVCIAGSVALFCAVPGLPEGEKPGEVRRPLVVAAIVASLAATVAGVVALVAPAMSATVTGALASGDTYRAAWTQPGAQTAAAWAAFSSAGLVLGAALSYGRDRLYVGATSLCAAIVAAAAYPFLTTTSFGTWNRWVPAEVQQAYGTEYSLLVLKPLTSPFGLLALGLAAVATLVLFMEYLSRRRTRRSIRKQESS